MQNALYSRGFIVSIFSPGIGLYFVKEEGPMNWKIEYFVKMKIKENNTFILLYHGSFPF
jgi:hypothetical protein